MLLAGEASGSRAQWIKAYCHDAVMTALDEAEPITGVYDEVSALDVLEEVIDGVQNIFGGINIDNCPTAPVTFVASLPLPLEIKAKVVADYASNLMNSSRSILASFIIFKSKPTPMFSLA